MRKNGKNNNRIKRPEKRMKRIPYRWYEKPASIPAFWYRYLAVGKTSQSLFHEILFLDGIPDSSFGETI